MPTSLPLIDDSGPVPTSRRASSFIKQFHGPGAGTDIVCFKFWELVPVWGCPFECAYCFLQTNTHARLNEHALKGLIYRNYERMLDEVDLWLAERTPRMLIVGELQDGLALDNAYAKVTGKPLTKHLIPLFARQDRHKLIFLTKSVTISNALKLPPTRQVVFSWSVNAEYAGKRWEEGAPAPSRRLFAAGRMKAAGWPVRVRLDPMIPYKDGTETWQDGYARVIDEINELAPEMVTLGILRASQKEQLQNASAKNGRASDVFDYLSEFKDPSGFKYRLLEEQQIELYRFALERLDRTRVVPALCKEDKTIWEALGLKFNGCHCLLAGSNVPEELISTPSFRSLVVLDEQR